MKKLVSFISLSFMLLSLVACASTKATAKPTVSANPLPFGLTDASYSKMIQESVYDKGNNARIKKVLENLRAGNDVYVGILGGSITEGVGPAVYRQGYAYQFIGQLKKTYTSDNGAHVHFVDAGVSGTPSTLGVIRYQKDVVDQLGHTPDLFIIEFAVNDSGDEIMSRTYEALIRKALLANEDTAIILLFSENNWTQQSVESKIGTYYNLPMVSIKNPIDTAIGAGVVTKTQFFADYVHPTKDGHLFMADCLMNIIALADKAPADQKNTLPATAKSAPELSGLQMISSTTTSSDYTIDKGAFTSKDTNTQNYMNSGKAVFPDNWYRTPGAIGGNFKMTITCKNLLFAYKTNGAWNKVDFGSAEVYVDGKLVSTFNGTVNGGWNNPITVQLINDSVTATHTVEIKMATGDEAKAFTLYAFGYTK